MFPVSKPRHRVVCIDRMEFDANGDINPVEMAKWVFSMMRFN